MENPDSSSHKFTNHLISESSPYLLQHAHNPVNWYPWGEEALEKARKENKLIIVSIGYSACHWCHVMEHESFEDEEVAKFMNEHFVAIKIDREERPDIDQIYMNAVQLITGRGGWPLNCIALPDGRPVYGGTYFPKDQWQEMLTQVLAFVKQNPEKTEQQAASLTEGVRSSERIYQSSEIADFSISDLEKIFNSWKKSLDFTNGGQNRAPKFPLPVAYQFLLHYNYLSKDNDALNAVTITLDKMADGGIYDQIGGGFARYSTDAYWIVPHFEKMLYDNAQLVSLYSSAYQLTGNSKYKTIVEETLDFIQRELTSSEGGFYSSLDADSEGEEGTFYVWSEKELRDVLGSKADIILEYYNVSEKGNWENGKNILYISSTVEEIAGKYNISIEKLNQNISYAKSLLFERRKKRIHPGLDDKILTSWNALMIKGYVDAYRVFNDDAYLASAIKNADFILSKMKSNDSRLSRNYKNGHATINAFLDDYAFTVAAFISLYQATFDEKWLLEAKQLTDYSIEHFHDKESGMFYYTSDQDPALIARKMEITDNVIPSSNSQMAKNMFILGHYFYDEGFIEIAKKMVNNVKEDAEQNGAYYANWDMLMAWFSNEPFEVAIVGDDFEKVRREFDSHYLPNILLSGGKDEGTLKLLEGKRIKGQTRIYVCINKNCSLPVTEFGKALEQISVN